MPQQFPEDLKEELRLKTDGADDGTADTVSSEIQTHEPTGRRMASPLQPASRTAGGSDPSDTSSSESSDTSGANTDKQPEGDTASSETGTESEIGTETEEEHCSYFGKEGYNPSAPISEWKPGQWGSVSSTIDSIQNTVLSVSIMFVAGLLVLFIAVAAFQSGLPTQTQDQAHRIFNHADNLYQVLKYLPLAAVACVAMTVLAGYVWRQSRSRQIDWTDSHLMIEHSGPLTLAIKWTAIESVSQVSHWDILHGKQPSFDIKLNTDDQFKLKLSDISLKHNVGTFFSMIKTNAPNAELYVDPGFASDNSYTELWLKYFSTPTERGRTTLLENGMLIDNGRYRILGTVGGGGQGTAYLAEVNDLSAELHISEDDSITPGQTTHIVKPNNAVLQQMKQIVLKEYILPVHRGQLTAERTAEKLRLEAEILQKIDHPQIVKLEDAFIEDFRGYLVLEYVVGEQLKGLVERLGPQQEEMVIDWALQTCSILSYLHGLSPPVVHRDITPDNLLLQEDGTLKLVDFNVAYQVDSSATATVVGKHAYIPAEQFRGKPVPQSDIYSLGGTMFFLLTGREPEPITQSKPQRINPEISDELNTIVARATASDLNNRFATVQELEAELQKLKAGVTTT